MRWVALSAVVLVVPATAQAVETTMVPGWDGTLLATDVYAGGSTAPRPVLVSRTPYDKASAYHADQGAQAEANGGYVYVVQDMRGRYASQGEDTAFRDDGADGRALLEWIDQQPWSNGYVATIGGSALGIAQYLMAPGASDSLRCQWIEVGTPDFYLAGVFPGSVRRGELDAWAETQGSPQHVTAWNAHPSPDDPFWDTTRLDAGEFSAVKVAAVHAGGWFDLFVQGTIDGFVGYQAGAPGRQKLVIGPWGHNLHHPAGTPLGEITFPDDAVYQTVATPLSLAFLKGCYADDWADWDAIPAVQIYVMGESGSEWRSYDGWPPPHEEVRFHLGAEGTLTPAAASVGTRAFPSDPANPAPAHGGNNLFPLVGPYDQSSVEARDDVVTFTTAPFDTTVEIIGELAAELYVSTDAPDVDLAVRLTDVHPDGRSMLITQGMQRARFRNGGTPELLSGEPVKVRVSLNSSAIALGPEHALRISVSGAAAGVYYVNPQNGDDLLESGNGQPATIALHTGPDHPSALVLPITDGLDGLEGPGAGSGGAPPDDAKDALPTSAGGCGCTLGASTPAAPFSMGLFVALWALRRRRLTGDRRPSDPSDRREASPR